MSFDIFLQRFENGDAADGDGEAVLDVLAGLIVHQDDQCAHIETADGEADVYGLDDPSSGLMINHASGRVVWDVIFDIAQRGGLAVMPAGCPTCIVDPTLVAHLPPGLPAVRVVHSGADILAAVETG